jgi:hypothetical protein
MLRDSARLYWEAEHLEARGVTQAERLLEEGPPGAGLYEQMEDLLDANAEQVRQLRHAGWHVHINGLLNKIRGR